MLSAWPTTHFPRRPTAANLLFRFAGISASVWQSLPKPAPPRAGLVFGVSGGVSEASKEKRLPCREWRRHTNRRQAPPRLGLRRMSHFGHRVGGALGSLLGEASAPSQSSPTCALRQWLLSTPSEHKSLARASTASGPADLFCKICCRRESPPACMKHVKSMLAC